jgi:Cys-tRNA(Pro)/Cys-tRNA(Cys) deacylase
MSAKLNAMRILEQHRIPYETFMYPDTIRDAEEVAEALGMPYFMVFKTLVAQAVDDPAHTKPYLVMIPSERRLDLKKLAAAIGVKKVRMAAHRDAEALTGLQVGGISALALTGKNWPVYLDQTATELQQIVISAGQRGTQLRVPVAALIPLIRARLVDVSVEADGGEVE